MWVKTQQGTLLNLDLYSEIGIYPRKEGETAVGFVIYARNPHNDSTIPIVECEARSHAEDLIDKLLRKVDGLDMGKNPNRRPVSTA